MNLDKRNMQGLVGTILFHGVLLIILLIFSFSSSPYQYPEPEGIVIDFGELVQGDESVAFQEYQKVQEQEQVVDVVHTNAVQNVATQDAENTITAPKKDTTAIVKNEISPEEIARQERERIELAEKARIDAMFKNKLDGSSGNSGNSETGAVSGVVGDPHSTLHGSRKGSPGNPYGNKDVTSWEKPLYTQNCNKQIQLTLQIDNMGNVIAITKVETALSEQACIMAARKAAMKVKFPSDPTVIGPRYANIEYEYTVSVQ